MKKTELRRTAWMRRGGRIAPKKRKPSEFARIYGSRARVRWIKAQPCVVGSRGCEGAIENAHTENGGIGRKADAATIVPLCHRHHADMHLFGARAVQTAWRVNLTLAASATEQAWRRYLNLNGETE